MMEEVAEREGETVETVIDDFLDEARPHIELGRPGEIEEVAPVVTFLYSARPSSTARTTGWKGGSVASV